MGFIHQGANAVRSEVFIQEGRLGTRIDEAEVTIRPHKIKSALPEAGACAAACHGKVCRASPRCWQSSATFRAHGP